MENFDFIILLARKLDKCICETHIDEVISWSIHQVVNGILSRGLLSWILSTGRHAPIGVGRDIKSSICVKSDSLLLHSPQPSYPPSK